MTSPIAHIRMSEDAYFEMLEKSPIKYEYWDGVAVAMAGGQHEHALIETNILGELFRKLAGTSCRPLVSNQAVKLAGNEGYFFPDATVVCGKADLVRHRGIDCLVNPSVVVEVLSPSTQGFDESDKLCAYTRIRSIREYLIVSSKRMLARLYFRHTPDEIWGVRLYELPTDTISLESCQCDLTLSEIYAGVTVSSFDNAE